MSFVKFEQQGPVAILTIDRPEALNALNSQVLADLDEAITKVEQAEDVFAVILTGAGRSFVAGADIGEMVNFSAVDGKKFGVRGGSIFLRLENLSKPVIAAINGFALGGGCELAMSCDIRIASEKAKFGQPEVGLGLIPGFGGTQRLSRLVGKGMAKYLIYTAEVIGAEEAGRIGLVEKVVEPEELMPTCEALAKTIMSKAPIAVGVAKHCINNGYDMDMKSASELEVNSFGISFSSEDLKEGTSAFLEKRAAEFKNK